ncbi:hypothetical protein [Streptomyces sp. NBC_01766]|uniref:hypothetical protein n=1 Tax=Streptomyces sp. NBC_01766 TaxID=2975936 RepID=UPI002DDAF221|nr:hypothetical protein [Streptomyces sp. NBC_01766]WSC24938.1 hypothetical protein OIE60_35330 [Streptomyces sp. NBC_01766]
MLHRNAAVFAAVLGLGRAGSKIGDFWSQSDWCAQVKGASDTAPVIYENPVTKTKSTHGTVDGRRACIHHCLTYTATQAAFVGVGSWVLGIRLHPGAAVTALAVSGITHYIADRRVPGGVLETLATKTGKGSFYKLAAHGLNGAFHLDSSWHHGWETVAALIAATKATAR